MDKDILRIVIITIGIMVMIGMVLWSAFRNRKSGNQSDFFDSGENIGKIDESLILHPENDDFEVVPIDRDRPVDQELQLDIDDNPLDQDHELNWDNEPSDKLSQQHGANVESSSIKQNDFEQQNVPEQIDFELPNIIQFHIFSLDYDGFNGKDLLKTFKESNLSYGKMKVFERLDNQNNIDFAIASMVEPGTFPASESELATFNCPGIVFFMQHDELDNPLSVFDEFMSTLNTIAAKLDGVKLDQNREPLTESYIQLIRDALSKKS